MATGWLVCWRYGFNFRRFRVLGSRQGVWRFGVRVVDCSCDRPSSSGTIQVESELGKGSQFTIRLSKKI